MGSVQPTDKGLGLCARSERPTRLWIRLRGDRRLRQISAPTGDRRGGGRRSHKGTLSGRLLSRGSDRALHAACSAFRPSVLRHPRNWAMRRLAPPCRANPGKPALRSRCSWWMQSRALAPTRTLVGSDRRSGVRVSRGAFEDQAATRRGSGIDAPVAPALCRLLPAVRQGSPSPTRILVGTC
jgi:hypothetical protein